MSSHHIVREKQEPALLVMGLEYFKHEWLGQLLEWSPTVIATAQTAEQLQAYEIKIDVVIGTFVNGLLQADVKTISLEGDVLGSALNYLEKEGYPAVNIITDTLQPDDYLRHLEKLNIVVYYHDKKISAVRSGFSKWKPAGEIVEILTHPSGFLYKGLMPVHENVFKTTHNGFFSLTFNDAFVLMAEQL